MNIAIRIVGVVTLLAGLLISQVAAETAPKLFITDGDQLARIKAKIQAGDPQLRQSLEQLRSLADEMFDRPMRSVVNKPMAPPSGDYHDYVSLSPYWWPNPDTADGLPYIRRDGEINPERDEYDVNKLGVFGETVRWLGFAYYYTGDERYAQEATKRIRHFLLDPETRMNPRIRYGQFVPGRSDGRKFGIIETLRLRWVPDAIVLLEPSQAMTDEDFAGARQWFADYAHWLKTSEFGIGEREGQNNHGTWCIAQTAYFSLFAGDTQTVREMAALIPDRVAAQFEPDGSQPHELMRTRALDYSEFNLRAHTEIAVIAEQVGIDLWSVSAPDGASIRKGLDFILPYASGQEEWPYRQISTPKHDYYTQSFRRIAIATGDAKYENAIRHFDNISNKGRVYIDLMIPLPEDFPKGK